MSYSAKAEAKDMLRRDIVKYGAMSAEELKGVYPAYLGYTFNSHEMSAWIHGMDRAVRFAVPPQYPRLVNRFTIGADPEFVFAEGEKVAKGQMYLDGEEQTKVSNGESLHYKPVHAYSLGLKTGLAFGCDLNGRLVELRVHPSRFVLECVASVLDTLRWMLTICPQAAKYSWIGGGYQFRDGLGGHVHFGRKRPTTPTEARALDVVWKHLLLLGAYSQKESQARSGGDVHGQRYGRPFAEDPAGAVRKQAHGYEYRVFPSWLDSPEQAYLNIVLAKLAVHDPGLLPPGMGSDVKQMQQRVMNLLRYYQGRDDDAAVCLAMLQQRGFPQHIGGDFRARWGLMPSPKELKEASTAGKAVKYYPRSIKGTAESTQEMLMALLGTRKLEWSLLKPTWQPTTLPETGLWAIQQIDTHRQIGLGEIAADLVVDKRCPIALVAGGAEGMYIDKALVAMLPEGWRAQMKAVCGDNMPPIGAREAEGKRACITVGMTLRQYEVAKVRKVLTCGVLPMWAIGQFQADSFDKWQANGRKNAVKAPPKMLGKLVLEEKL